MRLAIRLQERSLEKKNVRYTKQGFSNSGGPSVCLKPTGMPEILMCIGISVFTGSEISDWRGEVKIGRIQ